MDPERVLKRLLIVAVLFVGSMIAVGAISGPQPTTGPARPVGSSVSHEELQRDANMTQQMSTPNANTDAAVHDDDAQLQRSQNPGYVDALEQHQADIDRMLARGTP